MLVYLPPVTAIAATVWVGNAKLCCLVSDLRRSSCPRRAATPSSTTLSSRRLPHSSVPLRVVDPAAKNLPPPVVHARTTSQTGHCLAVRRWFSLSPPPRFILMPLLASIHCSNHGGNCFRPWVIPKQQLPLTSHFLSLNSL